MRNRALRGCLIVVFAVCIILLENIGSVAKKRVKPHPHAQQSQQQPEADKRGTIDAPFIIKSLPAEKNQQEADEDARDKNDKRWNDRTTIFIGIATAVILVLQLGAFSWQAHRLKQTIEAMKKIGADQSKDMQGWIRVADKSANAAKHAAMATQKSVTAIIDSERARFFVKQIRLEKASDNDPEPIISYGFMNIGRSPAIVSEFLIEADIIGETMPPEPIYDKSKVLILYNGVHPGSVFGSTNMEISLPVGRLSTELTPSDYVALKTSKSTILIKGYIRFRDVFGDTYTHRFAVANKGTPNCLGISTEAYNCEIKEPKEYSDDPGGLPEPSAE